MSSIRCPKCNLTNWVQAFACKRCGAKLEQSDSSAQLPAAQTFSSEHVVEAGFMNSVPQPDPYHAYQKSGQSISLKSGLAIASMVIGIVALPASLLLVGILLAPIALTLGIVALVRASKKPLVYGGQGFAIAGIATSSAALLFVIPLIAAIAIPNLLAAKRAADEGSAISSLRTLFAAESTYMATSGQGSCGDLSSLAKNGLIDSTLATGSKKEFRFEVIVLGAGRGCELFATPVSKSGRTRSFMISDDGVIRGANKSGLRADKSDPPLGT